MELRNGGPSRIFIFLKELNQAVFLFFMFYKIVQKECEAAVVMMAPEIAIGTFQTYEVFFGKRFAAGNSLENHLEDRPDS